MQDYLHIFLDQHLYYTTTFVRAGSLPEILNGKSKNLSHAQIRFWGNPNFKLGVT